MAKLSLLQHFLKGMYCEKNAIKTFVSQWNDASIKEACIREIKRGGQVYFLHNEVKTIEKTTRDLQKLMPEFFSSFDESYT